MREIAWLGLLALILAACAAPADTVAEEGTPVAGGGAVVSTAETGLGTVLVDQEAGLTLYLLTGDEGGESTCYDDCALAWPPLLTDGEPRAGGGADASLLGTTVREDGSTQVTYDGRPLYTFVQDLAPGDVNGQGIESFGGVWWAVGADGEPITATAEQEVQTVTTEDYGGAYDY